MAGVAARMQPEGIAPHPPAQREQTRPPPDSRPPLGYWYRGEWRTWAGRRGGRRRSRPLRRAAATGQPAPPACPPDPSYVLAMRDLIGGLCRGWRATLLNEGCPALPRWAARLAGAPPPRRPDLAPFPSPSASGQRTESPPLSQLVRCGHSREGAQMGNAPRGGEWLGWNVRLSHAARHPSRMHCCRVPASASGAACAGRHAQPFHIGLSGCRDTSSYSFGSSMPAHWMRRTAPSVRRVADR